MRSSQQEVFSPASLAKKPLEEVSAESPKQLKWQDNLLARMDERRHSYETVLNEFGKYVLKFETVCSTEEPSIFRKKSIKRKKLIPESETPKLPSIKFLSRYNGSRARNMGLSKTLIKQSIPRDPSGSTLLTTRPLPPLKSARNLLHI